MLEDQDLVSIQQVRSKVEQAHAAWQSYRNFSQQQVDQVAAAVAAKGRAHAQALAELAVEETGMGNAADKLAKNVLCTETLWNAIAPMRTVGPLRELEAERVTEIGVPQGVVAAICPTTNPTSTVFFKSLIALKSGNAIVISPHPRARRSTCAAAALVAEAVVEAGAPAGIIQCLDQATLEGTQALMKHPKTSVILATGGAAMVRAAYSSGKPAFGVGPGNVPVLVDTSADVALAIQRVVEGKTFDYGTVCSSEQTVVAERSLREPILAALRTQAAYVVNEAERAALERTLFSSGTTVRAECVGKSPLKIAEMAGLQVPASTRVLVAEIGGIGKAHPLSAEKLSPVLALHFVDDFDQALAACEAILQFGGLGHTSVIHAADEARVRQFGLRMPSFRVLVNTPSPQGSVGITTRLQPSMTLGCGAIAGNITSDNVGPQHLINIKRIAWSVASTQPAAPPVGSVDRDALIAEVFRYLAARGLNVARPPIAAPVAPPAAAAPVAAAPLPACACAAPAAEKPAPAPPAPACACSTAAPGKPAPVLPPPAEIPAPKVEIVDFVCEADVRAAQARRKKIFIGPRTIVTPAAREQAAGDETLVMAQR